MSEIEVTEAERKRITNNLRTAVRGILNGEARNLGIITADDEPALKRLMFISHVEEWVEKIVNDFVLTIEASRKLEETFPGEFRKI